MHLHTSVAVKYLNILGHITYLCIHRTTKERLVCRFSEFHTYAMIGNIRMLLAMAVFMQGEVMVDTVRVLIWYTFAFVLVHTWRLASWWCVVMVTNWKNCNLHPCYDSRQSAYRKFF